LTLIATTSDNMSDMQDSPVGRRRPDEAAGEQMTLGRRLDVIRGSVDGVTGR